MKLSEKISELDKKLQLFGIEDSTLDSNLVVIPEAYDILINI